MRKTLFLATFVAGLLALSVCSPLHAQNASGAPAVPAGTNVAVLDISMVFEHHQRFKAQMEGIKREIKSFEAKVLESRKRSKTLVEQLKDLNPGSPDYKAREAEIAKLTADMQVETALKKKEFLEREAKVYYNTYAEVLEHVSDFASRFNIGLVLRFNSKNINPEDRTSVLQGVNRAVVYQYRLDITQPIIDRLNRGTPPSGLGGNPQIPRRR